MGLKRKPNTEGETRKYVTRTQAIRRLQVSLRDFQRLCILKGVYPRHVTRGGTLTSKGINRRKLKKDKIYYHINDIRYLASGDLLSKFREIDVNVKRCMRLKSRGEFYDAKLALKRRPKYSLAGIVKQRCPSLVDAVSDLDDAVSTIALVASLPAEESRGLAAKLVSRCRVALQHFLKYVSEMGILTKGFISIKGYYFEATILNVAVRWLMPHKFAQSLPEEVDFNVIATFVEYYLELVKLVNYKLYSLACMQYPPTIPDHYKDIGDEFVYYKLVCEASSVKQGIFSNFRVFIASEVPLEPVALVVLSLGATLVANESEATHMIVDRPNVEANVQVEQVQPQYVFDCLNAMQVLSALPYRVGEKLPYHKSPFPQSQAIQGPILGADVMQVDAEITEDGKSSSKKAPSLRMQPHDLEATKPTEDHQLKQMQKALLPKKHQRLLSKIEFGKKRQAEAQAKLESKAKAQTAQ